MLQMDDTTLRPDLLFELGFFSIRQCDRRHNYRIVSPSRCSTFHVYINLMVVRFRVDAK